MPWIHCDDAVAVLLRCVDDERAAGAVNKCAPRPATNRDLSKALGPCCDAGRSPRFPRSR
jgi:NAD dependent epimerase/dehydratase family enzyme